MGSSGSQASGYVYNCITCQSCEFPLDCPSMPVERRSEDCAVMLSPDLQIRTQQVDQFEEVTVGIDRLYSIPSAGLRHQGTYQCEIYSDQRSLVRLYYHLIVIPQVVVGHSELQEIFDLSLLPGGRIVPVHGGWSLTLLRLPLSPRPV
ncbi:LOW QUALITY PROTEIN: sperm acrosome membrane-associated protein 6-like [Salvelinus alpinus]